MGRDAADNIINLDDISSSSDSEGEQRQGNRLPEEENGMLCYR